jgi:diaminopimelate decarboxylase
VAQAMDKVAAISLRVNPDVDANTHPYISTGLKDNKFGVPIEQALAVYQRALSLPGIHIAGVDCHIGSQLTTLTPFLDALDRVLLLVDKLAEHGITIEHLDLGGGLGVQYNDEHPPSPQEYMQALLARIGDYDAIVGRSATRISADLLKAGTKLKVVGRAGVHEGGADLDVSRLDAGLVEHAGDAVGRLRAHAEPVAHAVLDEADAVGIILGEERVVGADLLEVGAVAGRAAVGDHDLVVGALLGATARETKGNRHTSNLSE